MSDSFLTDGIIKLQPGSATVPYTFTFAACSSATANDGSLPFGSTIASAVLKVFDSAGVDKTSEIIVAESNTGTVCSVTMKYPATAGPGRYKLEFLLTLSTAAVLEFDFTRIYAGDD